MDSSHMTHWSQIGDNPISPAVLEFVRNKLHNKYAGPIFELSEFWKSTLRGKTLLDIGVVEHSVEFIKRSGWKHRQLRELARRTVGIDIIPDAVEKLIEDGFDVRLCDATSDEDLHERFDVVHIGDVIEHVNDPVRLLRFAARHLEPNGQIVVTTPCPFWWRNIRLMIRNATFIGNTDHVRWVCPINALELAHRADIELKSYYTIETGGNSVLKKTLHALLRRVLGRTELFAWAYAFSFSLED